MSILAVGNQKGGVGKCLVADTQIADPRSGLSRTLREVVEGDQETVYALIDRHHVGTLPIRSKVNSGVQPCLRVSFASGRSIIATRNHPFLLPDGWRPAKELAVGETAALPARLPHPEEPTRLSDAEVDLLAVLLAEGGCTQEGIRFSTTDPTLLERAQDAAQTLGMTVAHVQKCDYALGGRLAPAARRVRDDGMCRCGCGEPASRARQSQKNVGARPGDLLPYKYGHGRKLSSSRAFVRRHGLGKLAKDKSMPDAVHRLPSDQLARFLGVIFMCDGWVGDRGPCIVLASEPLIRSLQHLLLRFGIQSSVRHKRAHFEQREYSAWSLRVFAQSYAAFWETIPLWGDKRARLEALCARKTNPNVGVPAITESLRRQLRAVAPDVRQPRGVPSLAMVRDRLGWVQFQFDLLASAGGGLAREPLAAFCAVFDLGDAHQWLYDPSSEIFWDRVIAIEDVGGQQVYDLEVVPAHCFIANDIVVHNTTTVINLGAYLGALGASVLLVDCDPQANATSGLGVRLPAVGLYDVLFADAQAGDAVVETSTKGVHLLPSTLDLAGAEIELLRDGQPHGRLKAALDGVRERYSYILLDCPPSLGLLTINALAASDAVLVPVQCEYLALEGLARLMDTLERVRAQSNPRLRIFGLVLTMFDGRTTLSHQVAEEVRRHYPRLTFETVIPRSVRLSEAPSFGRSILDYDPFSRGAEAYQALAIEVASRAPQFVS